MGQPAQPEETVWYQKVVDRNTRHIVLKMRDPEPGACALNNSGMNDYVTESRVSADRLTCCIDRIVLRAEGVAATTKVPS